MGVAHPPGYPLFIYFGKAVTELLKGYGTPAYKTNVSSAAVAAVSAGMLSYICTTLLHTTAPRVHRFARSLISAAVGISYALSPSIWLYSIGAEVFVVNNVFIMLLLVMFCKYVSLAKEVATEAIGIALTHDGTSQPSSLKPTSAASVAGKPWTAGAITAANKLSRFTCWACFVCGLALCNQHTIVLLVIPLAAFVLWSQRNFISIWTCVWYAVSGMAGLLPYLHMPLAHTFWRGRGSWGDTSTISGFLRHLLRSDYGTLRLLARDDGGAENFSARTAAYARDVINDQVPHPVMALLAALGCIVCLTFVSLKCLGLRKASGSLNSNGKKRTGQADSSSSSATLNAPIAHVAAVAASSPAAIPFFLAFYFFVFHNLSNMPLRDPLLYGVHARFWLQPNALVFLLVGIGAAGIVNAAIGYLDRSPAAKNSSTGSDDGAKPGEHSSPAKLYSAPSVVSFAAASGMLYLAYVQHKRNAPKMKLYASDDVMDRYARALLEPLPHKAVLITSYDMQWTAARYLQTCEGVRPDIFILNGPVMSYNWFSAQRHLYPEVRFPGSHLVAHMTQPHAEGGFSLADFFAVNTVQDCGAALMRSYDEAPPNTAWVKGAHAVANDHASGSLDGGRCEHRHGGIFHTGSLVFAKDQAHTHHFDWTPHGIVSRVTFRQADGYSRLNTWRNITSDKEHGVEAHVTGSKRLLTGDEVQTAVRAFAAATSQYDGLYVNPLQYDASTWELATRIDFWAQAVAHATWLLEWALAPEYQLEESKKAAKMDRTGKPFDPETAMNMSTVLTSATLLEEAMLAQTEHGATILPSTHKNLGLAYVKLVRSNERFPRSWLGRLPRLAHIGDASRSMDESAWRSHAAERVLQLWSHYLTQKESRADSSYATIAHVVQVLKDAAAKAAQVNGNSQAGVSALPGTSKRSSAARSASDADRGDKPQRSGRFVANNRPQWQLTEEDDEQTPFSAETIDAGDHGFGDAASVRHDDDGDDDMNHSGRLPRSRRGRHEPKSGR